MFHLLALELETYDGWDPGPAAIDPVRKAGPDRFPYIDLFWWLR
jgi:hypothetical protein